MPSRSFSFAGIRIIADREVRLNHTSAAKPAIDLSLNKEAESRRILFDAHTPSGRFCDFGSGEADLNYLLEVDGNFARAEDASQNRERFTKKFTYTGIELKGDPTRGIIGADLCSTRFFVENPDLENEFAVVYSNNVFEHLRKPWIAAQNAYKLLIPGGVGIVCAPFSIRYHEAPADYFRYSHVGLMSLFEDVGPLEFIRTGYDILGRRNDWQGSGKANDAAPVDAFGAWRENWFAFVAFRKLSP